MLQDYDRCYPGELWFYFFKKSKPNHRKQSYVHSIPEKRKGFQLGNKQQTL